MYKFEKPPVGDTAQKSKPHLCSWGQDGIQGCVQSLDPPTTWEEIVPQQKQTVTCSLVIF